MQKKVFVYLLACTLPLLPACVRETPEQEEESISPITGEGSEEGLVKLEFSAALEDESRTWLDGTAVKWRGTDKIAVIDNTSPYIHEFDNTDVDGGARCRFVGEAGNAESWTVVYPPSIFTRKEENKFFVQFPAVQTAVRGGFANESYVTIASTTGKSFTMTPLSSLLKITLAYNNIKQIFIEANASATFTGTVRPLAGRFWVDITNPYAHPWHNGSSERYGITLNPPAGETTFPAGDYYVPIADLANYPPIANMRLTFTRQDNETASRTKTGASFSFLPGEYTDFGTVDEKLSWGYFDIEFATNGATAADEYLSWPFAAWKTSDDGSSWTKQPDPSDNMGSMRSSKGWYIDGDLKDSGHVLRCYAEEGTSTSKEKLRYAASANGFYLNSHVGSYIEFPAIRNRRLLRVEVQYDSTSRAAGYPYLKGHPTTDCPHITTTAGVDIDYLTYQRNANGFHHNYELYDTEDNTAYRYQIAYDSGAEWSGPRIQRIRLYYSKESASDPLTLPSAISATGYSKSLRYSDVEVSLTASDPSLIVGSSKCDVGIVLRNFRIYEDGDLPAGHKRDTVIFLNDKTPTIVGSTLTYHIASLRAYNNRQLDVEYGMMPFVRIKGDTTNPISEMTANSSGTNWRAGTETSISRPVYAFTTDTETNYLYASDTQATLKATVNITSPVAQAYDLGFIYREYGADDSAWDYTYYDQNGLDAASIHGYRNAGAGVDTTFTATLTGLTPGQAYEYKPVIRQHAACKFGTNASSEAPTFTYLLYGNGYDNSNTRKTRMAGPVVTVNTTKVYDTTEGYYEAATTGQVTTMYIDVSHLDPVLYTNDALFVTGIMYASSAGTQYYRTRYDHHVIGDGGVSFTNGVWTEVKVWGSDSYFLKPGQPEQPGSLAGLPDSDGATVSYRPYFAFLTGGTAGDPEDPGTVGYKYVTADPWGTFTCPVPSASSCDYLWTGATSANLTGTLAVTDTHCKLDMGYSRDGGSSWTITSDISAGSQTISATVAEGPQTVKFGVRRSGSSAAWKTQDIEIKHPIASVTTYASSWYEDRTHATVAGSFTTNKVASNDLVEYGFYYYDYNNTHTYTTSITQAPSTAVPYYTITFTDGVADAISRTNRLRGWFFARMRGTSDAVPTAASDTLSSSMSGKQMMTHSWDDKLGYAKRLYVAFNIDPVYKSSRNSNPFLPMNDSDYINELTFTYHSLCQNKKARVVGGQDIEFHLTNGSNRAATGAVVSGACSNNGNGRMRVYAATKDDYILLPCPAGLKIARIVAWMWGYRQSTYWTADEASQVMYAFFTDNLDSPTYVGPSYTSLSGDFSNVVASWENSLSAYPAGQPIRLHFAGASVSQGQAYNEITDPDRTELEIPGIWIDYVTAP